CVAPLIQKQRRCYFAQDRREGLTRRLTHSPSWQYSVHCGHTRLHVFVYMAVKHPVSDPVGNHIGSHELCRQQRKNIRPVPIDSDDVPVPVRCVDVHCATQSHHVPPHVFTAFHCYRWQVGKHVAVHRSPEVCSREAMPSAVKVAINICGNE